MQSSVASWTQIIGGNVGLEMAWFLWDDEGIERLLKKYEPDLEEDDRLFPYPREGGRAADRSFELYADVDTTSLKHPDEWVLPDDTSDWPADATPDKKHTSHTPNIPSSSRSLMKETLPLVKAIFCIEADYIPPPGADSTYWRLITNWALAMAPHHPVALDFLAAIAAKIAQNREHMETVNPLDITGPPAFTAPIRGFSIQHDPSFNWDTLSGRNGDPPGGRSKLVAGDVIILPITGFSPGRGWFQNMGSESIYHPNACLLHRATGSWRKMDLMVAYGKLCRSLFGMCKDWEDIKHLS